MNGITCFHGNPRKTARATVTAGLRCAPDIRPAAKMPKVTPMPQAQAMELWLP
ncbi:Uncharacterised protein [Mycobacteroides abscessus]|nr:Uncharacterised protein [Mycobacteroides abscessus]CQA02873.1 Uncharacterised protein [Mycobacteroides abscessus]SKV20996.1 Uncharacterised protein [Mycobacteroides abscessus subsp. abscessus]